MQDNGYIRLHRKLLANEVTRDAGLLQAWIVLLLHANFGAGEMMGVPLKPGQLVLTGNWLADQTGVSKATANKRLQRLAALKMVKLKRLDKLTQVTILKWQQYQEPAHQRAADPGPAHQGAGTGSPVSRMRLTSEPKKKKNKEEHYKKGSAREAKPDSVAVVVAFWAEHNLDGDPQEFWDHFTSNGWRVGGRSPMKDWKAAARNWSRRQKQFNRPGRQAVRDKIAAVGQRLQPKPQGTVIDGRRRIDNASGRVSGNVLPRAGRNSAGSLRPPVAAAPGGVDQVRLPGGHEQVSQESPSAGAHAEGLG